MSNIVNKGIIGLETDYIWKAGTIMAIVAIAGTICTLIGTYFASKVATGMCAQLRTEIFNKVQRFSLQEFDNVSTSSLITRTTNDTTQIQQVMVMIFSMLITAPLTLVVGLIMALRQDVGLSWILVVIMPILVGIIAIILIKAIPLFAVIQIKLDKLNLLLAENLTGIRVVRAFNRIKYEESRFDSANRDLVGTTIKVNQLVALMMPTMMFMINLSSLAIIWFGSLRVADGQLQIGSMFAFLQYAEQILFSLLMVTLLFIMIPRSEASAKRINEVLDMEPEIVDPKNKKRGLKSQGVVEFNKVYFGYQGAESPAISNVSFTAKPGQITAIIGGTGSGKSTILNLIPRFYDVSKGSILIDKVDTRDMSQDELRAQIGFVPQKPVLFSGTVNDNIRYGKNDATQNEIEHAAQVAQASEFITKMEKGFNSQISQGGTNVSGGQMQRLSIARALVRKPKIFIFDDTFSALDFKTDAKLRVALKDEIKEATVIIVAQRVSTVLDADQIIVLEDGKIMGIGKHKDLIKTCKVYLDIVSSQLTQTEISKENK
jgi:ATP-binding cassette subfamily B protein